MKREIRKKVLSLNTMPFKESLLKPYIAFKKILMLKMFDYF